MKKLFNSLYLALISKNKHSNVKVPTSLKFKISSKFSRYVREFFFSLFHEHSFFFFLLALVGLKFLFDAYDLDYEKIIFYLQVFFEPLNAKVFFFFNYRPFYVFEAFLPEIILGFWIIFLFIIFVLRYKILKSNNSYFLWFMIKKSFLVFFVAILLVLYLFLFYYNCNLTLHYKGFVFDYYVYFIKFFVLILFFLSVSCSYYFYQNYNRTYIFEIPIIFCFLIFFLMFLISSFDFLSVFFCTEGITFSLVTLLVYSYNYEDSTFSAVKYLTLASLSTGLFGFGVVSIFGLTGSTNFYIVRKYIKTTLIEMKSFSHYKFIVGSILVFVLLGFFFKLSLAPMHQWSIDIYNSANWGLIFIFSVVIKLSFFSVAARFLYYVFFDYRIVWSDILTVVIFLSFFMGSFGAISAFNMKEFVAYSSISQIGFVFLGLLPSNLVSVSSSLLFLFYYLVAMTAFFMIVTFFTFDVSKNFFQVGGLSTDRLNFFFVEKQSGLKLESHTIFGNPSKDFFVLSFTSLRNFSRKPLTAFIFSLVLVNLAGLPPFPGFFSKFFILMTLVKSKFFFYAIAALGFNVLSAFYYLRILMLVWVDFFINNRASKEWNLKTRLLNSLFAFKNYTDFFFGFLFLKKNSVAILILLILVFFMTFSVFFISDIWVLFVILSAKCIFFLSKKRVLLA